MAGLSKQYVYLAVIAVLLLLWRSARGAAEGFSKYGESGGWRRYGDQNIVDGGAVYMSGNIKTCKDACGDDCYGFTVLKRKNKYKKEDTKCWLLKDKSKLDGGYVNPDTMVSDQTKILYVKKAFAHTAKDDDAPAASSDWLATVTKNGSGGSKTKEAADNACTTSADCGKGRGCSASGFCQELEPLNGNRCVTTNQCTGTRKCSGVDGALGWCG